MSHLVRNSASVNLLFVAEEALLHTPAVPPSCANELFADSVLLLLNIMPRSRWPSSSRSAERHLLRVTTPVRRSAYPLPPHLPMLPSPPSTSPSRGVAQGGDKLLLRVSEFRELSLFVALPAPALLWLAVVVGTAVRCPLISILPKMQLNA
jgi:hypothetical protein